MFSKISFCAAALLSMSGVSFAESYPNRPVTIVVPFGPGGATDTYARYVADILARKWGQTVLVENRPGAGSAVGASYVANVTPDGYTLLWASTSTATALATQSSLPFDPAEALSPVVMVMEGDVYVVVGQRNEINSIEDLKSLSLEGKIFSGSPGVGSMTHFSNLIMNEAMGVTTEFVQFTSGANLMTDMGGKRIDTHYSALHEAIHYDFAKPIAVMSAERSTALPDVPTTAELGYPSATFDLWWGLLTPAGTPGEITEFIRETTLSGLEEDPAAENFFRTSGTRANNMSSLEFTTLYKDSIKKFQDFAIKHNIQQ